MRNYLILMTFKPIDGIILLILLIILGYLIYVTFIKHRNEPCKGCAYAKKCKSLSKEEFVKKYHKCKEKEPKKCPKCK